MILSTYKKALATVAMTVLIAYSPSYAQVTPIISHHGNNEHHGHHGYSHHRGPYPSGYDHHPYHPYSNRIKPRIIIDVPYARYYRPYCQQIEVCNRFNRCWFEEQCY